MTRKVFWDDPYRTTLDTVVTHVDGDRVRVDATIFFAFSGGQESDAGSLGDYPVIQAEKLGLDIVYTLPHDHALRAGDPVTWRIDWARRYRLMRLHFAAEMVLQLVYRSGPVSSASARISRRTRHASTSRAARACRRCFRRSNRQRPSCRSATCPS